MSRLAGWLNRLRPKDPLSKLSAESWNRICTVLEELEGVGCRVQKNTSGKGWKIIVDGTSDVAAPGGGLFPWGSQWPWGFEFATITVDDEQVEVFRLHNSMVRIGQTIIPAIVTGGETRATTWAALSDLPESGSWGVAVDLDWSETEGFGADLVLVADPDEVALQPEASDTATQERIPVAVFDGRTLVRDWVHGLYMPPTWVMA